MERQAYVHIIPADKSRKIYKRGFENLEKLGIDVYSKRQIKNYLSDTPQFFQSRELRAVSEEITRIKPINQAKRMASGNG
ncbi:MAG TPA: hypothetical protein VFL76_07360 [Edaphocola sp.]|nr:hypothetical protein [Edaphocola sp.]